MDVLLRPVTNKICWTPFETNSSTTYCTMGFRATGSISLGCDLVAGRSRVPNPATGITALSIIPLNIAIRNAIVGKEKAKHGGDSGTTRRVAPPRGAHRSRAAAQAPSALARLHRAAHVGRGGAQAARRALRNRAPLGAPPPPRQRGHFLARGIARRPAGPA